jgi:hypothetical protein
VLFLLYQAICKTIASSFLEADVIKQFPSSVLLDEIGHSISVTSGFGL